MNQQNARAVPVIIGGLALLFLALGAATAQPRAPRLTERRKQYWLFMRSAGREGWVATADTLAEIEELKKEGVIS